MPDAPDAFDAALFGRDETPRIVDVQPLRDEGADGRARVRVYRRTEDYARVEAEDAPFYPFFFLTDVGLLKGFPREAFRFQELDGDNAYRHLVVFERWGDYWDAVRHLEQATGQRERRPEALYLVNNPAQQYLMQTGRTCFKGMTFDDLHRLQLDIETYSEAGFPNASRPGDAVIIIALSDNRGWNRLIDGRALPERVMLEELVRVIREKDPDVIEGHNCFLPGTPVLTPSGYQPIDSFQVGDAVIGYKEQRVVDRVHQVHERPYAGDLVQLKAHYRSDITSTPNHPHFGFTAANGLGWHPARDFAPGDFLALPGCDTPSLHFDTDAYLAGLIFADGHLAFDSNRVSFGNTNRTLIDYVCSRIKGRYRIEHRKNAVGQQELDRVITHDPHLRAILENFGVPSGNKSCSNAPIDFSCVFEKGTSSVASFLTGVIDGDGHVSDTGVTHIGCQPLRGREGLFAMALHLGLLASKVRSGILIYPTPTSRPVIDFFRQHLKVAYKRDGLRISPARKYGVSGRYDHLPPVVVELLKPFIKRLGIRYQDTGLPITTINYLLNGRTTPRRKSIDQLKRVIVAHMTPDAQEDWKSTQALLEEIECLQWFRLQHVDHISYEGPVYNIGTGSHSYIAHGVLTHNCYAFDFPYLMARCERHGVPFAIGRDGSVPRTFASSMRFAERTIEFPALEIAGRHVVDTYFQVMSYDVFKRDMRGYGLKAAARYFGFAPEGRTYVEGDQIGRVWKEDPARLLDYALDDVVETERLARHLSGSTFYLTQLLPMPYGQVARTGPAAKIESLFVREYLRRRHSLPKSEWGSQAVGGYTDVFVTGVVGPVVYADVESLYPSIMLGYDVRPRRDALGLFPELLRRLTDLRFDAKRRMKATDDPEARGEYDARQSSYKVLINSFYGMLGFTLAAFNDFAEADRVAATGQELLRRIIALIRRAGGTVVEVDTDGVLFVPPADVRGEEAERAFVDGLSEEMPEGIRIGFDGRFRKMLSYKKKNYALLTYDGKLKYKGSSLVSRSTERFGRQFVRDAIRRLLDEDVQGLHDLYLAARDRVLVHAWESADDFARTETLKDSVDQYQADVDAGKRTRAAAYELAIRQAETTGQRVRKGDRISYYVTGTAASVTTFETARLAAEWDPAAPDENTAYYLKRLDEFARKFEPFFTEHDFRLVFSPEDLFGFSAEGIRLQRQERAPDEVEDDVPF